MNYSRRNLSLLLPALTAAKVAARAQALPSKMYSYPDLPVKVNGSNRQRAVFNGETHTGYPVDLHLTELAPGEAPHPPHHHLHEEILMIFEGTMEVTIAGRSSKLGPGSVAYVNSGEEHGWRNVGTGRANYFVIAMGRDK